MSLHPRSVRTSLLAGTASAVGLALALAAAVPSAQASAAPRWRIDEVLTPASGSDCLYSVAAISSTDAWAAGMHFNSGATRATVLVERYNGRGWKQVAIPADLARLSPQAEVRVSANSPANVWVFELLAGHSQRILRWDGHRWHLMSAPAWIYRSQSGAPIAVAVFGRVSAWVFTLGGDKPTGAARYVNGRWKLVRLPGIPGSIDAVSGDDIWASGVTATTYKPIIMHWNGHRWTSDPAPAGTSGPIAAANASAAWVLTTDSVEYWNGTAWTAIALPAFVSMIAIVTDGHGGVWLWGLHASGAILYTPYLFAHYAQGTWTVGNAPALDGDDPVILTALAQAPGSTTVLGVGEVPFRSPGTSGAIMRYGS